MGFLSYWTFSKFTYVEHFAVKPGKRRKGVGTFMLEELKGKIASQVLIEVELPSTPEAKSRIRFYEQRGFCINRSFDYVQPPYSQGLPEVSMLIMTHGNVTLESTADLSELIVNVYGAEV